MERCRSRALCLALLASFACAQEPAPVAQPASPPQKAPGDLAGLWKARRWFGPFARGPLVIRRSGTSYTADMMGRTLPVRAEGNRLSFDLPDQQGGFRGALLPGGAIRGHWVPPPSVIQGMRYASPVELAPDGRDRWSGQVTPFEDVFTIYLMLRKRPDGSMDAFIRNPERNYGVQLGANRLVRNGSAVRLLATADGKSSQVASGSYNAERDEMVLEFPGRGRLYEFRREGEESDFYPRGARPGRYAYQPPLARADGWPTGSLAEAAIDQAAIERFIQLILDMPIESVETPEIHAVLVARRGRLVLEEYFHGEHRDKLHDTRSAAKSLTATIAGAAFRTGKVALSTPVYRTMLGSEPADLDPRKRAMTLEHLLTMSSGYFCDDNNPDAPGNEERMQDQSAEPDWYRYTLQVPMATAPGEKSVYCSANPNLALGVVGRATGESPLDLFDRLLAVPMEIRRYGWDLDPAGHPYGGGGVQFRPRDFMKFGQLMLNRGTWQGRPLLDRNFAARASSSLYYLAGVTYGYQWWVVDVPYKKRKVRSFFAGGNGGQGVTVVPELDLVIATFAGNYNSWQTIHIQQELPVRYILPAVREPGDDPRAPVVPREDYKTPYGKSSQSGPVTPSR
jgi:CubicO group peptidase (beta-lactamase class C family)